MYHAARETRGRAAGKDTLNVDVAIVGAGPAGSRAAFASRAPARAWRSSTVHPREKPCGGGVTGRALALVADAVDAARLPSRRIRAARFVEPPAAAPSRFRSRATRSSSPAARNSTACCLTRRARRAPGSWRRAPSTSRASPDGSSSTPAQAASRPAADRRRRREQPRASAPRAPVCARGALDRDRILRARRGKRRIVVELAADPPGYLWSFPRPGHLAVGICAQADAGATAGDLRRGPRGGFSDWRWPRRAARAVFVADSVAVGGGFRR